MRRAGDPVPEVTFKLRQGAGWTERSSREIFDRRLVVLFALPGAFATTCAARHLPGYVVLARNIRAMGVDEICCLSVNDPFVMNAWARDQGIAGEVTLLPDGDAEFTRQMGRLGNWARFGFGQRSWRYSMLVRDGVIERLFEEDPKGGEDPLEDSDAITMLDYLDRRRVLAASA